MLSQWYMSRPSGAAESGSSLVIMKFPWRIAPAIASRWRCAL
jgi:hypothetical protein